MYFEMHSSYIFIHINTNMILIIKRGNILEFIPTDVKALLSRSYSIIFKKVNNKTT